MMTKLRTLLLDLLITGFTYYRVIPNKQNVKIEVLNPLDTYVDVHPESPYAKHAPRAVIRKWLTKEQITSRYGEDLTKEELESLEEAWSNSSETYITVNTESIGIMAGYEVGTGDGDDYYKSNLIPVYEVEWIETDSDYVM